MLWYDPYKQKLWGSSLTFKGVKGSQDQKAHALDNL